MAGHQAIRAVGEIVLSIMREGCPFTTLQVGPDAKFEFAFFNIVVADTLTTADYLALWDRVKTGFPAGMAYVARMVLIDSDQPEVQGRLVTEREFGLRQVETT